MVRTVLLVLNGSCLLAACMLLVPVSRAGAQVTLASPDGRLRATIADSGGQLQYQLQWRDATVLATSPLGVIVDGREWGKDATLGQCVTGVIDETYATRGVHAQARNHCNTVAIAISQGSGKPSWTLEARAFNDGFAWRYRVAEAGSRVIQGESSAWTLPAGSKVWYFERQNAWKLQSYAGEWLCADIDQLPIVSKTGPVQGPPLVAGLPKGGYLLISEAALYNYSGLRLRAVGQRRVQADFTECGVGKKGFVVEGPLVTPWRVAVMAVDLDGLVNSDLIANLNPPPDKELFADTSHIKPGRCVWRWWSQNTGTPEQELEYVDFAARLGFEYTLVDDGWKEWPQPWEKIAHLAAIAKGKGVGVWVWSNWKDINAPAEGYRAVCEFLDKVKAAGLAGVKIDFMNGESKDRIDFEIAVLREAARRQLMVSFHGCQKPTGESRTWPNELTREGIRGLELNKMKEGPITAHHNAALPFTRFAVGPGDYTPLGYSRPGATTWAHQLATVVLFTSPLQVIAENPRMLLDDPRTAPALDVLKAIPAAWDETRVLPPSEIGTLAMLARRSGPQWFLAGVSGREPVTLNTVDLSFLGKGEYRAILLTSPGANAFKRQELPAVTAGSPLAIKLDKGDGFILMLIRSQKTATKSN